MYRRRATLVNLHSLRALTKVCSRPTNSSLLFVNKFQLCRFFSTAIERPDFYSINESNSEKGTYNFKKNEDLSRNEQNRNRVYGQNTSSYSRNELNSENGTNNFKKNGDLNGNELNGNRVYSQNASIYSRNESNTENGTSDFKKNGDFGRNEQNGNRVYGRNPDIYSRNELNSVSGTSNFKKNGDLSRNEQNVKRIYSQNPSIYSRNESNSESGTSNFQQNGNLGRNEQSVNRVYVQNLDNQFQYSQDRSFDTRFIENGQRNEFVEHQGNKNGRFSGGYVDLNQKNGNLGRSEQNANGVFGQNPNNQFQQNQDLNFAPAYIENGPRNELLENRDGRNGRLLDGYVDHNQKNGNFGVYNGSDGKAMWQQSRYESKREYAGGFQQNGYGNNYVQSEFASAGNSSQQYQEVSGGSNQSSNGGYSGGNSGNLQQRWDRGNYSGNYEIAQHSGVNQGNLQQSCNAGYSGGDFGSSQRSGNSGYSGASPGNLQRSWTADTSGQNSLNLQQSWGVGYSDGSNGRPHQNWNEDSAQIAGMHQKTSHANYTGNGGNLQFPQGNHNAGNIGAYHGNTGLSNNQGNIGEYQQITGGSLQSDAGFLPHTSNQFESGYVGTLGDSSAKPNEVSEAITVDQVKGTIDELDKFYQEGKLKEAVDVLGILEGQHISVDLPRYLLLFKACGEENALEQGKSIHKHLLRSGLHLEVKTHNKILEMYCSCGSLDDAFDVFDKMPMRNLTTWDTMISWLAKNGHGEEAVELFTQFKETGLRPDGAMFSGIFSACGMLGDTVEGLLHFESMKKDYSIVPSMEHYISVIDMLGTAGNLDEALEFIEKMPLEPSIEVWEVLMNLCRMHGNLELGDRCAELVEVLDPSRLDEQSRAGYLPLKPSDPAKDKEKKKSGQSFPEGRSRVHEYRAGDKSQPELYDLLRGMKQQLKEAGYIPEVKFVLHDIDQEGKEEALMAHSERLAVAQEMLKDSIISKTACVRAVTIGEADKFLSAFVSKLLDLKRVTDTWHLE
ncbi:hypothetical protein Leryth_010814 [Lithospermum erythrorhizon]|nr:hypothetical protein Leryth_010814 [Lithospermum erythrorhizon]